MAPSRNDVQLPHALTHLLATYLATAPWPSCPGGDGLLDADVLADYPAAVRAGTVPGEAALCSKHPELEAQIVAFFFLLAVAPALRPDPPAPVTADG